MIRNAGSIPCLESEVLEDCLVEVPQGVSAFQRVIDFCFEKWSIISRGGSLALCLIFIVLLVVKPNETYHLKKSGSSFSNELNFWLLDAKVFY